VSDMLDRYEMDTYKQWLRVYMRSKLIKHNKDLLQWVGDTYALLNSCTSIDGPPSQVGPFRVLSRRHRRSPWFFGASGV
jgi:hypothetical protein